MSSSNAQWLSEEQKQLLWLADDEERQEGGRHANNMFGLLVFLGPLIAFFLSISICYKTQRYIKSIKNEKTGAPLPFNDASYVEMIRNHARDPNKYYSSVFARIMCGTLMVIIVLVSLLLAFAFPSTFNVEHGDAIVLVFPRYSPASVNKANPNGPPLTHLPPICDMNHTSYTPSSITHAPVDALLGRGQGCSPLMRANIVNKNQIEATNFINYSYAQIRCEKDRNVSFKFGASLEECNDRPMVTYKASSNVSYAEDIVFYVRIASVRDWNKPTDYATLGCLGSLSQPNGSPDNQTASILQIHPDVALMVGCFYDAEEAETRFKRIEAEFFVPNSRTQVETVAAENIDPKASYRATRDQDNSAGSSNVVPIVSSAVNSGQDFVWDHHTGGTHSEWKESTLPIGLELANSTKLSAPVELPRETRVPVAEVYLRSEEQKTNSDAVIDASQRPTIADRAEACCGYRFPPSAKPDTTSDSFLYDLSAHVAKSAWRIKDIRRTDFDVGHMVRNVAQDHSTDDKFSITFWVKLWAATPTFHGSQGVVFAVMDDLEPSTGLDDSAFFRLAATIDDLVEEGSDHGYFDAFKDRSRAPYLAFYVNARRKKLALAMNDEGALHKDDDSTSNISSPMFIHVWDRFEDVFDNHWHHIALSFRETSGHDTMNIYIDGVTALAERKMKYTVCLPTQVKPVEEASLPKKRTQAQPDSTTTTNGGMILVGGFFGELFALQFHDSLAVEPWHVAYFGADTMKLSDTDTASKFTSMLIFLSLALFFAIVALIRFCLHRREEVAIETTLAEEPTQFSPTKCNAAKEHAAQDHNRLIAICSVKKAIKETSQKYRMAIPSPQQGQQSPMMMAHNPLSHANGSAFSGRNGNSNNDPPLTTKKEDEEDATTRNWPTREEEQENAFVVEAEPTTEILGEEEEKDSNDATATDDGEKAKKQNKASKKVETKSIKNMRQQERNGTENRASGQKAQHGTRHTNQSSSPNQTTTTAAKGGFAPLSVIIPAFITMMQEQSVIVTNMRYPALFTTYVSMMYMTMFALPQFVNNFAFISLGIGSVCLFAVIATMWVILMDESDFRQTAIRRMMAARREVHGFVAGDDISSSGEDIDEEVERVNGSVGQLAELAKGFQRLSASMRSVDAQTGNNEATSPVSPESPQQQHAWQQQTSGFHASPTHVHHQGFSQQQQQQPVNGSYPPPPPPPQQYPVAPVPHGPNAPLSPVGAPHHVRGVVQQPPFQQPPTQGELDPETLLNNFQTYQQDAQRRREKRQTFPIPTGVPTFFYEFTIDVVKKKKVTPSSAKASLPRVEIGHSTSVIATLHCTPSTRRHLNEALRLMYSNEEWEPWRGMEPGSALDKNEDDEKEPLKTRSMKQNVEFDESLEFSTNKFRDDGESLFCDVGMVCTVEATEEQVETPEHPVPRIKRLLRPSKVSRQIRLSSLRFVSPSTTSLPSWVPEQSEQEQLEFIVKPSLPKAVKDTLAVCPIHGSRLMASVPVIHDKVLQEGRLAYKCMFHQDGNLACCDDSNELLAQECSDIHTQRPAFLVCPCDACGYVICKPCAMQIISFKDRMLAIFRASLYRLKRRGPTGLVGLFVVMFAQLLYIPVIQVAMMILSCHHSIRCAVSCQDDSSLYNFFFLFFGILTFLLFCFPIWLFYIIVQRKRLILRCGILDALLESTNGGGTVLEEQGNGGSLDAAGNIRRVRVVQPSFCQALLFDIHPSAWEEVLSYDDSILRSFYQHATFRFMWVQPVMIFFRPLVVIPAIFAEPNSQEQIFAFLAFQGVLGFFLVLSRPYNTSWLNLLLRFYVVYELIIIGLGVFHVVPMYDTPFGDGMAIPMILVTAVVLLLTLFIVYKVTIQPIFNASTEVNPLERRVRGEQRPNS